MQRGGVAGHLGASVAIDRKKGFAEAIKNAQTSKLSARSQVTSPAVKAKNHGELYQSRKQRQKHLHGLRHNDDMVIGAIQAIKEAGLKPVKISSRVPLMAYRISTKR